MVTTTYFDQNVCKHFAAYLKLYGRNRDTADVMTKIGTMSYNDRRYKIFERGNFGWWKDEDRVMVLWCASDESESVMLFNYCTGKWVIETGCSDVYQMWFDKIVGWMSADGGRTFEQMKEAGYDEVTGWMTETDDSESESDESDESGETGDNDENCENKGSEMGHEGEENVEEIGVIGNIFNSIFENETFTATYFLILLYFIFIIFIGTTSDHVRSSGVGVAPVDAFNGAFNSADYYCDNGVCFYVEDLD